MCTLGIEKVGVGCEGVQRVSQGVTSGRSWSNLQRQGVKAIEDTQGEHLCTKCLITIFGIPL